MLVRYEMLYNIINLSKRYLDSLLIFKILNLVLSFALLTLYIKHDLIEIQSIILIGILVQLIHPGLEYQLMVKVLPKELLSIALAYNVIPIIVLILSTIIFSLNEVFFFLSMIIIRCSDMLINLSAMQVKRLHSKIGILWFMVVANICSQFFLIGYLVIVINIIILLLMAKPFVRAIGQNKKTISTSYLLTLLYALPNITVGLVGMTSSITMQETYIVLSRSYGIVQKVIQIIRVRLLPHAIKVKLGYRFLLLSILSGTWLLILSAFALAFYFDLNLSFINGLFTFYIIIMSYSIYNNIMPVFLTNPKIRLSTDIASTIFLILIATSIESDEIILWSYSVFIFCIYLTRTLLEKQIKV